MGKLFFKFFVLEKFLRYCQPAFRKASACRADRRHCVRRRSWRAWPSSSSVASSWMKRCRSLDGRWIWPVRPRMKWQSGALLGRSEVGAALGGGSRGLPGHDRRVGGHPASTRRPVLLAVRAARARNGSVRQWAMGRRQQGCSTRR